MTMKNKDIINNTLFSSIKEVIVEVVSFVSNTFKTSVTRCSFQLKVRPSANGYRIVPCTFDANEAVNSCCPPCIFPPP